MMQYKVIDIRTGADITKDCCWIIRPDGELYYLVYGDLIGCPTAKAIPFGEDWNK